MTQAELRYFLKKNKDAIFEATRAALIEKVKDSVRWNLPDTIQATINTFFKDEIAPEITKLLLEQKGVILAAATKTAAELSNKLGEKMLEQVVKGLDGYRAEEVFKALLGIKSRY